MTYDTHITGSIMSFDDYYMGDMDEYPAIFVLSSFKVDDYYFDKKEYPKSKMKEVAESYRAKIEANSKFPIYCYGTKGKYIITPSPNVLLTSDFYDYEDFKYTISNPFHFEYFTIPSAYSSEFYSPKAFIRKICNGLGAEELIPKLLKHVGPIQEFFDNNIDEWNTRKFKIIRE